MKVLVIGDAIVDKYLYGKVNRQSPEDASVSVFDESREEYRLGGCMNVAANIRSISYPARREKGMRHFEVQLSSVFSKFTGNMLFNKGILCDSSNMIEEDRAGKLEPCKAELIKTRVVDESTQKQLIRIDNREKYSNKNIELYKESLGPINNDLDAVVVSDYNKGLVNGFTLEKLKNYTGQVFVDSKNPDLSFWEELPNCIVKVNDKEYKKSTGGEQLRYLIVTNGSKGATLYDNSDPPKTTTTHCPTNAVENGEVTGAGDVWLAGFVVDYMRNKNLLSAMDFANMCAGKSVKQHGTTEVRLW